MTHLTRAGWAALALLTVGLSGGSPAEAFGTGHELGGACAEGPSVEQAVRNVTCLSYIAGFVDAYQLSMAVLERQAPRTKKAICLLSRGIEKGQVMALVNDRLKRTPTELDQSARTVLWSVLATAYPCQ
jgi:Rap1a immunity proteins